jgi:small subunit ribosomal protein S24e
MELEIKENNDNPLLHRKEIKLVINHENDSTPKRNQVIRDLSEQLKAKKELIIIDHLKNKYGKTETQGYAKVYSNIEALKIIETKPSMARHANLASEPKQTKKTAEKKPEEEAK